MDVIKTTDDYMKSRLRKFNKDEIIEALLALGYATVDSIVNRCEFDHMAKEHKQREQSQQQFLAEKEELNKCIAFYNSLAKKAREEGLTALSLEDVNKMRSLLDRIDKIQKRWVKG